jgi:alkylation response protein AidB-like acyl-CoA dehydrogenase
MIETEYDDQQRAFADAVRTLGERLSGSWAGGSFPERTWRELGAIGLFDLATDDSGAVELAAVMEELGRLGCSGPLWETVYVVRTLGADVPPSVLDGSAVAVVASGGMVPWGSRASVVLDRDAHGAWLCEPAAGATLTVLTGDSWTAATPRRLHPVDAGTATALAETAAAAYLTGAAGRLIADAAGYVAVRRQFGRPLGDLQAVAHPLAQCDVTVAAARALTRRTAAVIAAGRPAPTGPTLVSAVRAARATTAVAFQVYGAMAFTEESPVAGAARRITEIATAVLPAWRRRAAAAQVLAGT